MRAFSIREGILIKENENEGLGGKVAQEDLRNFCCYESGKRKKKFYKNIMKFDKKFYNRQCLKTFCEVVYARDK
jgi:hypothetical protein